MMNTGYSCAAPSAAASSAGLSWSRRPCGGRGAGAGRGRRCRGREQGARRRAERGGRGVGAARCAPAGAAGRAGRAATCVAARGARRRGRGRPRRALRGAQAPRRRHGAAARPRPPHLAEPQDGVLGGRHRAGASRGRGTAREGAAVRGRARRPRGWPVRRQEGVGARLGQPQHRAARQPSRRAVLPGCHPPVATQASRRWPRASARQWAIVSGAWSVPYSIACGAGGGPWARGMQDARRLFLEGGARAGRRPIERTTRHCHANTTAKGGAPPPAAARARARAGGRCGSHQVRARRGAHRVRGPAGVVGSVAAQAHAGGAACPGSRA
jgi:hypothetical protein